MVPIAATALVLGVCAPVSNPTTLDKLADRYVQLVLDVGTRDPGYVDMVYGLPARQRNRRQVDLRELARQADALTDALQRNGASGVEADRQAFLRTQVTAVKFRIEQLQGRRTGFDQEALIVAGFTAPTIDERSVAPLLAALDRRLPGAGPLAARLERFSRAVAVPPERVEAVVDASLAACRSRTLRHIALPAGEHVEVVYVRGRPWSAYANYQGNFRTRVEINIDTPRRPDQILELMCHETYPGHHLQYTLLESRLVRGRGWRELQILPLLSPASVLAEGVASAGVDLALARTERSALERDLFRLAGVSPDLVPLTDDIGRLTRELAAAGTEGVRRYLDGRLTRAETALWLEHWAAMPRPAEMIAFTERFRTYVVGYTEAAARAERIVDNDWHRFEALIADITAPSRLARASSTEYLSSTSLLRTGRTREESSRRQP